MAQTSPAHGLSSQTSVISLSGHALMRGRGHHPRRLREALTLSDTRCALCTTARTPQPSHRDGKHEYQEHKKFSMPVLLSICIIYVRN